MPDLTATAKEVLSRALDVNIYCCDCGDRKPSWVSLAKVASSTTLAAFCCYACASQHRSLGTHICRVKSCTLNEWSAQEIEWVMNTGSNDIVNAILEGGDSVVKYKPKAMSDSSSRKEFIQLKYGKQQFFNRFALQDFLLQGPDMDTSEYRNGASSGMDGDDDFDDLFDDSKTTTSDLFGHCTKTGSRQKTNNFMAVMDEEDEEEEDGRGNFAAAFGGVPDTEPAPFDPFAASSAFAASPIDPFAASPAPPPPPPSTKTPDPFGSSRHRETLLRGGSGRGPSLDDAFGKFSATQVPTMSSGASVTPSVTGNPDITNSLIERLEAEKRKAVAEEDYVRAAELKHQIELERLEEEKRLAVEAEDYIRAAELKKEIDNYRSKPKTGRAKQSADNTSAIKQSLHNFLATPEGGEDELLSGNNNSRRSNSRRSHHISVNTGNDDKSIKSFGEDSYSSPRKPIRGGRRDSTSTKNTVSSAPQENEVDDFGYKSNHRTGQGINDYSQRSRSSYASTDESAIASPAGSLKSKVSVQSAPPEALLRSPKSSVDHDSPGAPKSPASLRLPPKASRSSRSQRSTGSNDGNAPRRPARRNVDRTHSSSSREDDEMFLREVEADAPSGGGSRRRPSGRSVDRTASSSSNRDAEEDDFNDSADFHGGSGRRREGGSGSGSGRRGSRAMERHSSASSRDDDEMFLDKTGGSSSGTGSGSRGRRNSTGREEKESSTSGGGGGGRSSDAARNRRRSRSATRRRRPARRNVAEANAKSGINSGHNGEDDDDDDDHDGDNGSGRRDGRSGMRKAHQLEAY